MSDPVQDPPAYGTGNEQAHDTISSMRNSLSNLYAHNLRYLRARHEPPTTSSPIRGTNAGNQAKQDDGAERITYTPYANANTLANAHSTVNDFATLSPLNPVNRRSTRSSNAELSSEDVEGNTITLSPLIPVINEISTGANAGPNPAVDVRNYLLPSPIIPVNPISTSVNVNGRLNPTNAARDFLVNSSLTPLNGSLPDETEPFPDYYESCENDVPAVDEVQEQAYNYAVSKLAETVNPGHPLQSHIMTGARTVRPNNTQARNDTVTQTGFVSFNRVVPSRPPYHPPIIPPFSAQATFTDDAPGYTTDDDNFIFEPESRPVIPETTRIAPQQQSRVQAQEQPRRIRRQATDDEKLDLIEEMSIILRNDEIKDEVREKFVEMTNNVLHMEYLIFLNRDPAEEFLSDSVVTDVQAVVLLLVEYFNFLDDMLDQETHEVTRIGSLIQEIAYNGDLDPATQLREMCKVIVRKSKKPRPIERRLLSVFLAIYDTFVYDDFLNVRNHQMMIEEGVHPGRLELTRMMITAWDLQMRTIETYEGVVDITNDIKTRFVDPTMALVSEAHDIWFEEVEIREREVDATEGNNAQSVGEPTATGGVSVDDESASVGSWD